MKRDMLKRYLLRAVLASLPVSCTMAYATSLQDGGSCESYQVHLDIDGGTQDLGNTRDAGSIQDAGSPSDLAAISCGSRGS